MAAAEGEGKNTLLNDGTVAAWMEDLIQIWVEAFNDACFKVSELLYTPRIVWPLLLK